MAASCYVSLAGGLGNQLFEIATAYAHARRTGKTLQISQGTIGGRPTYWRSYLHKCADWVVSGPPPGSSLWWKEPHFHYAPIPASASALSGYFQSSKYFNDVSEEIRELFDPHPVIKNVVNSKYADFLRAPDTHCVIHIRRTDYYRGANVAFHVVCDKAWYMRALAEMDRRCPGTHYLVFSDDLDWCRAAEQTDMWAGRSVSFVDERNDCASLFLMSHFRKFIISNSTFSWWATWLQPTAKTVIAPTRWFGPAGPQDWQDIYEPDWIPLP